jgi:hypothetical protein
MDRAPIGFVMSDGFISNLKIIQRHSWKQIVHRLEKRRLSVLMPQHST